MGTLTKIILKKGKEQSIRRFHPWIFSGAIEEITSPVEEGDLVEVYSHDQEFLAIGHCQVGTIAVRILSFEPVEINDDFWKQKISAACSLRQELGLFLNAQTNVFRLIHGEGDGMPGLIVDFYNGTAVMQMHSIGMYLIREKLAALLKEILGNRLLAVYDKSEGCIPEKSGIEVKNGFISGSSPETIVLEYGNKFKINWEEGQKTGFFIDQRENRRLLQQYTAEKTILNMFGYTGGFSVYAMRGGASLVHTVDVSEKAVELASENVALNFSDTSRHKAFATDAFEFMRDIDNRYDVIILDPPAFAKHNSALHNALQGYKRLNTIAFKKIKAGGILFTFSCSQVVSRDDFRKIVFTAAAISGRRVRIIHQLEQPADHPVNIFHPEGEYLKGLVLYIEK